MVMDSHASGTGVTGASDVIDFLFVCPIKVTPILLYSRPELQVNSVFMYYCRPIMC